MNALRCIPQKCGMLRCPFIENDTRMGEEMTERIPDALTWSEMINAGIDVSRVRKLPDNYTSEYQGISADGQRRITFGVANDVHHVTPKGTHTGWDAMTETLAVDGEGWDWEAQEYWEPEDWRAMLARVAEVCPR